MHAAKSPFPFVERNTALGYSGIEAVNFKFLLAKGAGEKSPLVFVRVGADNEGSSKRRLKKLHNSNHRSGLSFPFL